MLACSLEYLVQRQVYASAHSYSDWYTSFVVPTENVNLTFHSMFAGRNLYMSFEAVDSAFYVWVNGVQVGYRYILS